MTFQDVMEWALDQTDQPVFPNTERDENGAGRKISRIIWHEFRSEEQVLTALQTYREAYYESEVSKSACADVDFTLAELPKRVRRDKNPIICEKCAELGTLGHDGILNAALSIIQRAHEMQAEVVAGGRRGYEAKQKIKPYQA